jgi:putative MATE family efflux protein
VNKKRTAPLVEGQIFAVLARMTGQMLVGILGMVAFNLVDTWFVGQLGSRELAAMAFTFPVIMVVGGLTMGISVGAAAVVSRAVGEEDRQKVRRLTTDSLILACIVVLVVIVGGFLSMESLFRAMGANEDTLPLILEYMKIWYGGALFVVVPMVGNSAIRGAGDAATPARVMMIAFMINLILDPILIFGIGPFPRMELAGAAIATVIARAAALVVSVRVLAFRDRMLTLNWPGTREILTSWGQILHIGLPNAATNLVLPLGIGLVTRLISRFGEKAVGAFGAASRVDMFAMTLVMALASVLA